MYNEHGLVIEPAGVLSLCLLDLLKIEIKEKNVVCVISGGNADINRIPDILSKANS